MPHENIRTYSSEDAVDTYEELVEQGLFADEYHLVDKYFQQEGRLLDIGCGAGRTTHELAERGHDVIGMDISKPMIDRARAHLSDVPLALGDGATLPFADNSFEYVLFSFNGIDYLHPEERRLNALREIRRVLRPHGRVAFNSHNSWYSNFFALEPRKRASWREMKQWWQRAIQDGTVGSRYKREDRKYGETYTYFIDPISQKRQLRNAGFELLGVIGNENGRDHVDPWPYHVYFDRFPYYVAEPHSTGVTE
ncbi:class I SAM-dependent methyltransferase [Natrinema salaciae]|uniref:Ubiquinone/menaquinone biosynthesis C-methylase UbiE n=1 Tax=Natrinema salaciae TaxID=1186196 RepID=A0A1H9EW13_9EURY|nr:class I SAM-dependent methyltransferase [Natrinema salaciae]SEQ29178.1 Ubiquinone/menaquinone biosynthesis C-methylase UbiE [Natrinema salaciae]